MVDKILLLKVACYVCNDNELEFNMTVSVVDSINESKWMIIGENTPVCDKCYAIYMKIAGVMGTTVAMTQEKKQKARAKSKRRRADNTPERDEEIHERRLSNLEKAWAANTVDVNCPECGQLCKSHGGLGNHRLHRHGIQGTTGGKKYRENKVLYDAMQEKREEKRLIHYPVYECRWFGEDTENTAEAKCGCVKAKSPKGHNELLAHEKHSHSKKYHPISEEFRKTTYRSRKV